MLQEATSCFAEAGSQTDSCYNSICCSCSTVGATSKCCTITAHDKGARQSAEPHRMGVEGLSMPAHESSGGSHHGPSRLDHDGQVLSLNRAAHSIDEVGRRRQLVPPAQRPRLIDTADAGG